MIKVTRGRNYWKFIYQYYYRGVECSGVLNFKVLSEANRKSGMHHLKRSLGKY